jgi:hypothetical protein
VGGWRGSGGYGACGDQTKGNGSGNEPTTQDVLLWELDSYRGYRPIAEGPLAVRVRARTDGVRPPRPRAAQPPGRQRCSNDARIAAISPTSSIEPDATPVTSS